MSRVPSPALMRDPANAVTLGGWGLPLPGFMRQWLGEVHLGAACLALALFADMTDGWVARRSGAAPRGSYVARGCATRLDCGSDAWSDPTGGASCGVSDWSAISLLLSVLLALCAATR